MIGDAPQHSPQIKDVDFFQEHEMASTFESYKTTEAMNLCESVSIITNGKTKYDTSGEHMKWINTLPNLLNRQYL